MAQQAFFACLPGVGEPLKFRKVSVGHLQKTPTNYGVVAPKQVTVGRTEPAKK